MLPNAALATAIQQRAEDGIRDFLQTMQGITERVKIEGLDLGGLVNFTNRRLIAIETDGNAAFQDYLGITGDLISIVVE